PTMSPVVPPPRPPSIPPAMPAIRPARPAGESIRWPSSCWNGVERSPARACRALSASGPIRASGPCEPLPAPSPLPPPAAPPPAPGIGPARASPCARAMPGARAASVARAAAADCAAAAGDRRGLGRRGAVLLLGVLQQPAGAVPDVDGAVLQDGTHASGPVSAERLGVLTDPFGAVDDSQDLRFDLGEQVRASGEGRADRPQRLGISAEVCVHA